MKPSSEFDETFIDETFIDETFIDETFIVKDQGCGDADFADTRKHWKPLVKSTFCEHWKPIAKSLIKPMENEAFWSPKPQKGPKIIQKALPREGFRIAIAQRRESL